MKYLVLPLFVFSLWIKVYSQEYNIINTTSLECICNYEYQRDSLSKYSKRSQEMTLLIGRKYSMFVATHNLFVDSLIREEQGPLTQESFNRLWVASSGTIIYREADFHLFKNLDCEHCITLYDRLNDRNLKVIDRPPLKWQLHAGETKQILSYTCY